MPAKAIASAFMIITAVLISVWTVELTIPLAAKSRLNSFCREAMLRMELNGGMSEDEELQLIQDLRDGGFYEIVVDATRNASYGSTVSLNVECRYLYKRLSFPFVREEAYQQMFYKRSSIARRISN